MAEVTQYQRLNPLACSVAAACIEFIFVLVIGFPMIGMGVMEGMMGGYAFAVFWWLVGTVIAALAGAIFAFIYNAINR